MFKKKKKVQRLSWTVPSFAICALSHVAVDPTVWGVGGLFHLRVSSSESLWSRPSVRVVFPQPELNRATTWAALLYGKWVIRSDWIQGIWLWGAGDFSLLALLEKSWEIPCVLLLCCAGFFNILKYRDWLSNLHFLQRMSHVAIASLY